MNLEEYLISKKIDPTIFKEKESDLWKTWSREFENMHPNSFTIQKLNLINPIRRKYPLKSEPAPIEKKPAPHAAEAPPATSDETETSSAATSVPPAASKPTVSKPVVPRPVFKPKPKTS